VTAQPAPVNRGRFVLDALSGHGYDATEPLLNTMSDERPVALFDSGVGGLAILAAVRRLLPGEDLIYYADRAHFPYGSKTDAELRARTEQVVGQLLARRAKLIVVACNTATSAAIDHLRATFAVPFVGVEPGVKPAVSASPSGRVAVLATEATAAGARMARLVERFGQGATVRVIPAPELAAAIERGDLDCDRLLEQYLAPARADGVDTVVLGCTHYGLVRDRVQTIVGPAVRVIDTAEPVARRVAQVLEDHGLGSGRSAGSRVTYLGSGDEREFTLVRERLRRLLPGLP